MWESACSGAGGMATDGVLAVDVVGRCFRCISCWGSAAPGAHACSPPPPHPPTTPAHSPHPARPSPFSCACAQVIGATSSLTYNVVGHVKTVIILSGGVMFFGDSMPAKKVAGIMVAMAGIVW